MDRKLAVAKVAALTFSVGVVGLLATQAGLAGCRSTGADAQPEPLVTSPASAGAPGASSEDESGPSKDDPRYMGGAKAPAGNWAWPPPEKPAATGSGAAASAAQPQAPQPQAPSPQQKPR